jgi:hypothetical protein
MRAFYYRMLAGFVTTMILLILALYPIEVAK